MEVGDDSFYDLELIARGDDDLRSRYQRIRIMLIQIIEDVLKGSLRCQPVVIGVVRHPLFYDEIFGSRFGVALKNHAHVIETFQGPYGSRSYGDDISKVAFDTFDGTAADGDKFRVHLVPFDRVAFYRFKGTRSDMQGDFFPPDAPSIYIGKYFLSEMKSGGRCGDRAFYLGINCLIGL